MFKKIKKLLKDHVQKDFVQDKFDGIYPFGLNDTPDVKYKSFGEKNPDKIFYVIYRTPYEAGFFSNYKHVAMHLKAIEGTGLIPVVDFKNFKTFYNVETPINGTENAWEYYFEQISSYSLDEVYQSKHVLFCGGKFPYHVASMSEKEYGDYCNKILNVKEDVLDAVSKYDEIFSNNKVMGIHFRGKDLNIFPGHPFGATEEQMFKYTDEIIKKYDITKIFLATNEQKYLESYVKKYGEMVFSADIYRIATVNEFNINPRENHRYLLGKEVLIDFMLLLKCQGLLYTRSNILGTARAMRNYEFLYSIYNGLNSKNKYRARYLFDIKKRLPKKFGGLLDEIEVKEKHEPAR